MEVEMSTECKMDVEHAGLPSFQPAPPHLENLLLAGMAEMAAGNHQPNNASSSYASLFALGGSQANGMLGTDISEVGEGWSQEDDKFKQIVRMSLWSSSFEAQSDNKLIGRLLKLVTDLGKRKWNEVAELMPGKKPISGKQRLDGKNMAASGKEDWTEEEDRTLVAAHSRIGERWQDIAKVLDGRSPDEIKIRWLSATKARAAKLLSSLTDDDFNQLEERMPLSDENQNGSPCEARSDSADMSQCQGGVKPHQPARESTRPWTPDEDDKLIKLVEELGQGKWTQICRQLPGRTVMQCRQRYLNKLDPSTKKGEWTEEEDRKIVAAQSRMGNRWQEIAKFLDGRSDFNTQRRWLSVLQSKAPKMLQDMQESDFAFLKNVVQLPKKERQPWSQEEDSRLIKLVEQYGQGKWTLVAKQLGTSRTGLQCRQRYLGKLDPSIRDGPWTDDEDRKIVAAQSRMGNRWQEITKYLEGRSWVQTHQRWFSYLQPRAEEILNTLTVADFTFLEQPVKDVVAPAYGERHLWSKEEDAQLLQLVNEIGQGKWTQIAKRMPGRLPKQCRQRFFNKVDPSLSNAAWTEEEDRKIVAAQSKLGNRFAEIAKFLEGRSESVVSHRWHLVLQWKKDDILRNLSEDDFNFLGDTKEAPRRERKEWTHEEDMLLLKLVEEQGQNNWQLIAANFPGRHAKRCRDRYLNKLDPSLSTCPWTDEEDRKIVAAQSRMGNRWQEMSKRLEGRSERAVKERWFSVLQHKSEDILSTLTEADYLFLAQTAPAARIRRGRDASDIDSDQLMMSGSQGDSGSGQGDDASGDRAQPWTSEEDALLVKLVEELGQSKWSQIAKQLPGRQPKQCRARYTIKQQQSDAKEKWTEEEDRKIVAAYNRLGSRFAEIAKYLEGRNDKMVAKRWAKTLSRTKDDILATLTKDDYAFLEITHVPAP